MIRLPTLLSLVAACMLLFGCGSVPEADLEAERAALQMVTSAKVDRPDGDLDISWLHYVRSDDRLTTDEIARVERFCAAWAQRVDAGAAAESEEVR